MQPQGHVQVVVGRCIISVNPQAVPVRPAAVESGLEAQLELGLRTSHPALAARHSASRIDQGELWPRPDYLAAR